MCGNADQLVVYSVIVFEPLIFDHSVVCWIALLQYRQLSASLADEFGDKVTSVS